MLDYIRVGKIINTHGIKGYVKCLPLTDDINRFNDLEYIFTELDSFKRKIKEVWFGKGLVYLKLENINDVSSAEKFKNTYITIEKDQLKKLPEDTYYIFDIEGLSVYNVEGKFLGEIKKVLQTGANDVYVVEDSNKQYLIPAIKKVIKEINIKENRVVIQPLDGLIE